jgi:putative DNA primase/helicase
MIRQLATTMSGVEVKGRSASFCKGVETFARADPIFSRQASDWDKDPWLLGAPAGIIDLRSGRMRQGDGADMITKAVAVMPADRADCPLWRRFLFEATGGDKETIRFLQLWAGYCLTGVTSEHVLVFIFGDGGTGKTVFLNTVRAILGDYAMVAAMETFTVGAFDRHPTELAMLRGARLVTASETEAGKPWAEARIKLLTGGDPITAHFMRQDNFTYQPQFKLMIAGNHRPTLKIIDEAARRRFRMVPFTIKPSNPDRKLEEKLREEWPGILRWMIDGCQKWQRHRLPESGQIKASTEEYFNEQDMVKQWINDRCIASAHNECQGDLSSLLYFDWKEYAERRGEASHSNKWLSGELSRRGFNKKPTNMGIRFSGIRLKGNPWEESEG